MNRSNTKPVFRLQGGLVERLHLARFFSWFSQGLQPASSEISQASLFDYLIIFPQKTPVQSHEKFSIADARILIEGRTGIEAQKLEDHLSRSSLKDGLSNLQQVDGLVSYQPSKK